MYNDLANCLKIAVPYGVFCFVVHVIIYATFSGRLKSLSTKDKAAFYNRAVSTLHAIIMFCLSVWYWLILNPGLKIGERVDDYQARCTLVMLGYLLYDTIFELTSGKQAMTIAHHVLGAMSHTSVLASYNGAAGFYTMMIFIAEGSTPLLNASWLLQKLNMLKTSMFAFCAMSLILSFFLLRVVLSPVMLWHMWTYQPQWGPDTDLLFKFNFIIVFLFGLLNYYWFYKLVQLALKK